MLIYKDLPDAGLPEHQALKGLLAVGSEFMVEQREDSEVRRAGEFIEMRRRPVGEGVRLCAVFESSDARRLFDDGSSQLLGDDQDRAGGYTPVRRTGLFTALIDEQQLDRGPDIVGGFKQTVRLARYTKVEDRVHDVDHTAQEGRGRVWHLGDGEHLLLVRERFDADDPRFFMGVTRSGATTRRTRLSRVELVKIKADTGKSAGVLMAFETFSGLGFDPGNRAVRVVDAEGSEALYDAYSVYTGRAGHLWGRFTQAGYRMDPSASYAVAEPAWHPDRFLSLVAVHGRAVDALRPDASILRQLSCSYTDRRGEVQTSTITFPAHPDPAYIWSAIETELLRVSPTALLLRVLLAAVLAPGIATAGAHGGSFWAFFWSGDAGATWAWLDLTGISEHKGLPQTAVGMMAGRNGKALLFTANVDLVADGWDQDMIVVHEISGAGGATLGSIDGSVFSAGLDTGTVLEGRMRFPRYWPVAFGGGAEVRAEAGTRQALWMQFDPFGILRRPDPHIIDYPNARPMLLVSLDGGASWQRRMLPEPWPQRVGFVVSAGRGQLLVPVYAERQADESGLLRPLQVRVHASKDGGQTWKKRPWRMTLPAMAWVDGQLLPGSRGYDITDYRYSYNRGELFPLVAVRDERGDVLPMNPGRPWIADARVKEPAYA